MMNENQKKAYYNMQEKMAKVAEFAIENMEKDCSPIKQAEFNIIYNQYHHALEQMEAEGISEKEAVAMETKCPVHIPPEKTEMFKEWVADRLANMVMQESVGFQNN